MSTTSSSGSVLSQYSSKMRLTGLASGLDTDSIVSGLMKIERQPYDKLDQQKQLAQWRQEAYRDVISSLNTFKTNFFDYIKPTNNILSPNTLTKYKASTANSADADYVAATGGAGVGSMSHTLIITQLAEAAKVQGKSDISSDPLNKLSLTDTMETINTKLSAAVTGETINFSSNPITIKINGKDIIINKSDTLNTAISKINSSTAGVTISYSQFLDKFQITSDKTGAGNITLDSNGTDFFEALGLSASGTASDATIAAAAGKDAQFKLDGKDATDASNTFTIDGVTYNLKKADPLKTISLTLSADVDAVYNTLKSFVDDYNTLIDKLNTQLNEKYDKSYLPLTQDQRDGMTEDQITKWEAKAKTGILRNDSMVKNVVGRMREALYTPVEPGGLMLADIGITTGLYSEKGKLHINETKLKEAISTNLNQIAEMFTKTSSNADAATKFKEQGLAVRLSDILTSSAGTVNGKKAPLLQTAGQQGDSTEYDNMLYYQIRNYSTKMSDIYSKLAEKEKLYYSKYAQLEKYMTQMSAQSSWLSQQFGG